MEGVSKTTGSEERRGIALPNNLFKPFAALTRTLSTPRMLGHGFAILPENALCAERRLTRR